MANVRLECGRRAVRKAVDIRCAVTPRRGRTRRLRMTELSPLGAWLRTTKPMPTGTLLDLRLTLPDGERVALRAEVMWSRLRRDRRGAGMGVELVGVDPETAGRIADALEPLEEVAGGGTRFTFRDLRVA